MNSITRQQARLLALTFAIGIFVGWLFNANVIMAVIGFVIVNVVGSALLAIMEAKLKYWLYIGSPTLGFVIGYFGFLGGQ